MSSTNKTTYYELSQYTGSDKPTYLGDYNADMGKIDAGIHTAKNTADTNTTNIGDLTSLTTESKSTLVGAVNEVDSNTDTNTTNIETNRTNIATNTSNIGVMANLETTVKSSLVEAINEVDSNVDNINTYLSLIDNRSLTNPVITDGSGNILTGASVTYNNMRIGLNSAGTYGKIYGNIGISGLTANPKIKFINTGIKNVSESFTITPAGIGYYNNLPFITASSITVSPPASGETSASITLSFAGWDSSMQAIYFPCIYYFTDFGDIE